MRKDSYAMILKSALRLCRRILSHCGRNKFLDGHRMWITALLARIVSASDAALLLIQNRMLSDAKLIERSILDATLDLLYILADSRSMSQKLDMFEVEAAVDGHDLVEFYRRIKRVNLSRFLRKTPSAIPYVERYEFAKNRLSSGRSMRWRQISSDEKRAAIDPGIAKVLQPLEYTVRKLGDSVAHSRMPALEQLVRVRGDDVIFRYRIGNDGMFFEPDTMSLEMALCVILAADAVVDKFYLQAEFSTSIQNLHKRFLRCGGCEIPVS